MDNQHRKIKGYRELSQEEVDLMNSIKNIGITFQDLFDELQANPDIDKRWLEIGRDKLQVGLMCLTRSVAKPGFF